MLYTHLLHVLPVEMGESFTYRQNDIRCCLLCNTILQASNLCVSWLNLITLVPGLVESGMPRYVVEAGIARRMPCLH